ncbi:hypothetical protein P280DRAFT_484637 [Massarina eburnea CBS 473.64]|uniref:F-box domain-containing protein n=1 Tax=Massarina eburnea CBS 473.64 TaxID=1395130 RepID=A0A6A6RJS0_9PLEO|nr:hypothetical protein P280DRAFT_484637 [Massarina eburnea CBS 473.64]
MAKHKSPMRSPSPPTKIARSQKEPLQTDPQNDVTSRGYRKKENRREARNHNTTSAQLDLMPNRPPPEQTVTGLSDLPHELFLMIVHEMDLDEDQMLLGLINLAASCKSFRKLTQPELKKHLSDIVLDRPTQKQRNSIVRYASKNTDDPLRLQMHLPQLEGLLIEKSLRDFQPRPNLQLCLDFRSREPTSESTFDDIIDPAIEAGQLCITEVHFPDICLGDGRDEGVSIGFCGSITVMTGSGTVKYASFEYSTPLASVLKAIGPCPIRHIERLELCYVGRGGDLAPRPQPNADTATRFLDGLVGSGNSTQAYTLTFKKTEINPTTRQFYRAIMRRSNMSNLAGKRLDCMHFTGAFQNWGARLPSLTSFAIIVNHTSSRTDSPWIVNDMLAQIQALQEVVVEYRGHSNGQRILDINDILLRHGATLTTLCVIHDQDMTPQCLASVASHAPGLKKLGFRFDYLGAAQNFIINGSLLQDSTIIPNLEKALAPLLPHLATLDRLRVLKFGYTPPFYRLDEPRQFDIWIRVIHAIGEAIHRGRKRGQSTIDTIILEPKFWHGDRRKRVALGREYVYVFRYGSWKLIHDLGPLKFVRYYSPGYDARLM